MKKVILFLVFVSIIFGFLLINTGCKKSTEVEQEQDTDTKYTLKVTLSNGVNGNPAAGTHSYTQGQTVNYNYTLANGYTNLTVTIDGQAAAASGTITMNGNRTINVTAEIQATNFKQSDLTGTWSGTIGSKNIKVTVDSAGEVDYVSGNCAVISVKWTMDSSGKIKVDDTDGGMYTENFSNWGQASWNLQMSNDKKGLSGTMGALVWGSKSVDLTKE